MTGGRSFRRDSHPYPPWRFAARHLVMHTTIVLQIPVESDYPLNERIESECDVKWAAGYRLSAVFTLPSVTAGSIPASIVLVFQPIKTVDPDQALGS